MAWGRGQQPQQPGGYQGYPQQGWQPQPPAPAPAPARVLWEYKVLEPPAALLLEETLNNLGAEGWELVEIDATPTGKIAKGQLYVFKRPKV